VQPQSNVWWIGPLVLVLIRVVVGQARKAMAIRQCDSVVFGVAPLFRWLGGFFLVAMCLLFVRDFRHEESWVLVTGAVGVGLFCLAWPASFICSGTGLVKHIWWRRAISLPWSEVVQLEETQGGDLNVYGGKRRVLLLYPFPRRSSAISRRSIETRKSQRRRSVVCANIVEVVSQR
jgi:hypothetical protein